MTDGTLAPCPQTRISLDIVPVMMSDLTESVPRCGSGLMSAGLIVERRGNVFIVFCNSGDYEIDVAECSSDYEVGSWLGLFMKKENIVSHGLLDIADLPEVRVVQEKAEVLTSGRVSNTSCQTKDFGCIPLLCPLQRGVAPPSTVVQVWARRLTPRETDYFDVLWGVSEIVAVVHKSPSPSRSTPEADREVKQQLHHSRFVDDRSQRHEEAERVLADLDCVCGKMPHSRSTQPDVRSQNAAAGRQQQQTYDESDFTGRMHRHDSGDAGRRSPSPRRYCSSPSREQQVRKRPSSGREARHRERDMIPRNGSEPLGNTWRRSPSPPSCGPRRNAMEQKQSCINEEDDVVLLGVITNVVENICNSEFIGYVWTRDSLGAGVLHLGSDPHIQSRYSPGFWIEFILPVDYARVVLGPGSRDRPRFEISYKDCRLVTPPFPTFAVRNSIEIDIRVSVPELHRRGDDYVHRDLGAIADPKRLLEGGSDYILRITVNRPSKMYIREETAKWKVLEVKTVGESRAPRYAGKAEKAKRLLPSCNRPSTSIQRPSSAAPRYNRNSDSSSGGGSPEVPRTGPTRIQGPPAVPATQPAKVANGNEREKVTEVAMVESHNKQKGKYRLWLTKYHMEAVFYSDRVLKAGHFFQGRFSIGGKSKNKCHHYLQEMPAPEGVRGYYDEEAQELELYVDAMHKNRKNGTCYEVYHEIIGYVRDTQNLLAAVDEPTPVTITARRLPCASEGGRLTWQIHRLGAPVVIT
ncbi:hypothetical protein GCK32_002874 [Trichostrongylus colubriformis]|uniref:Uncharacterized protein n=1 Tax=Trichostrongylus colubriformis TaxID=6319 RepID=A0AAN8F104_TRICO